jgi:hypothetical protein
VNDWKATIFSGVLGFLGGGLLFVGQCAATSSAAREDMKTDVAVIKATLVNMDRRLLNLENDNRDASGRPRLPPAPP